MSKRKTTCFVIMPFSKTNEKHTTQYWTRHFKSFLKPLIEGCPNVKAYRSKPLRGDILKKIITDLITSPIVVADLTDLNPNVYWELGVRQSFKHGTITIAEHGTEIPFDLLAKSVLFYSDDHLENADFTRDFIESINDILNNPDNPDSHVLEAISGRGTLYEIIRRDEAIRRLDAVISECEYNRGLCDMIKEVVTVRKEKPLAIAASRMRTSGAELLVTQRYLDKDSAFYFIAEEYYSWMEMINQQLAIWAVNLKGCDEFFKKRNDEFRKQINVFLKAVVASRKNLETQL